MTTSFNLGSQPNIDRNQSNFVVVFLNDPSPNSEDPPEKMKSGLIRISSSKQWHQKERTLKNDFQAWTIIYSRTNDNSSNTQFQESESGIEFDDVEECFRQVQNYAKKHVLLVLSNKHAQNRQLIDRFMKSPQIARIVQSSPVNSQQQSQRRPFYGNERFFLRILPKRIFNTPVEDLDETMKLLLMEIFLEDVLTKFERSHEAEEDFENYCKTVYHNMPNRLEQLREFREKYDKNNAIHWYTRPNTFIYRLVSKVFGSLSTEGLFHTRLIACDLYQQLKEFYEDQLNELRNTELIVYRGMSMSRRQLSTLQNRGELYVTRPFLSVTTDINVALQYAGYGSRNEERIPVVITMTINSQQIKDSILARIDRVSANPHEKEVMLFRGLIFSIESYNEEGNGPTHLVRINMIRGENEVKTERCLREKYWLMVSGATSPLTSLFGLLKLVDHHPNVEGQASQISCTVQSSNPQMGEHLSSVANVDNQLVDGYHNLELLQNEEPPCHTAIDFGEHLTAQNQLFTDPNAPAFGGIVSDPATQLTASAQITPCSSSMIKPIVIVLVTIGVIVVGTAIGVPLGVLLTQHTNATEGIITEGCHTSCRFLPSVQNPSPNYQVERLNLSCSQTLINMTIIQIVQRNHNETPAQQYQTFWNQSTNMTYTENLSEIIYQWFSLPGMYIVWNSFPHFIEAQFYYTPGSTRATNNDTWMMSATTICGEHLNFSGTF